MPRPPRQASAPDPSSAMLKCVQCRRAIEVLNANKDKDTDTAAFSESVCRSVLNCAVACAQDLPLCTSCWRSKLATSQTTTISELSSLVETLSTVKDVHAAAIAAFKDLALDVDPLTQQYVVNNSNNTDTTIIAAASSPSSSEQGGGDNSEQQQEELEYEREREELERELLALEQGLAGRRRDVKRKQAVLDSFGMEEDSVERQLNGVEAQDASVRSAAQSAAARLQAAKSGFAKLGLTVTEMPVNSSDNAGASEILSGAVVVSGGVVASTPEKSGGGGDGSAATGDDSLASNQAASVSFTPAAGAAAAAAAAKKGTALSTSASPGETPGPTPNASQNVALALNVQSSVPLSSNLVVSSLPMGGFDSMNSISSTVNLSSVLSAAFHLEFDDQIGRANGRRVGRLPANAVQDEEINAGCGFLALLMNYLLNTYTRMERTLACMDPQGCASTITIFAGTGTASSKRTVVDFHIKRRFFSWSTFGQAWVTFSSCTNEVVQSIAAALRAKAQRVRSNASFAPSTAASQLVQRIDDHIAALQTLPKISQNGQKVDDDNVKYGDASDEKWTSAVRGLLKLLHWSISADKYLSEN